MGRVERHQCELAKTRRENDGSGFRIGPDVELRRRRDIADRVATAHDHHLGDQLGRDRGSVLLR